MSTTVLQVSSRDLIGTSGARAIRKDGGIPGVVYGDSKKSEAIFVQKSELLKHINKKNFFSSLFSLEGIGTKTQKYIVKDVQYDPVSDVPVHIDFLRVGKGSRVVIKVRLRFVNEEAAPGLKRGGVLNILAHEIDVECDPDSIPDTVDVDLTGFEFHHTVHAYDLKLPTNVSLSKTSKNFTIATVVAPTILKADEETAAEGAAEDSSKSSGQ